MKSYLDDREDRRTKNSVEPAIASVSEAKSLEGEAPHLMSNRNTIEGVFNVYVLPTLLFIVTYLTFGFYYFSSDDALVAALIRGFPFGIPVKEFFFCHRLTAAVYADLTQIYSGLPWYEMAMCACMLLSIINYFSLIHQYLKRVVPSALMTPILVSAYVLLFLNSVIALNFTEVSIFVSASAILRALAH